MGSYIDMSEQKFGRLSVISDAGRTRSGIVKWKCVCECGSVCVVQGANLRNGHTKSCGCIRQETIGSVNASHGLRASPEYRSWSGMIQRCEDQNVEHFRLYGGRGIRVCDRWRHSFEAFHSDMGPRPDGMTIDRIDNDGNYEPGNCRWASREEQGANRRSSIIITLRGEKMCLAQACRRTGIHPETARKRLLRGWSHDEALGLVSKTKRRKRGAA